MNTREGILFNKKKGPIAKKGEIRLLPKTKPIVQKPTQGQKGGSSSQKASTWENITQQLRIKTNQQAEKLQRLSQIKQETQTEVAKEKQKVQQQFSEVLDHGKGVLYKTCTVFPFDFFPNDIIIDLYKVNIINREFFASEQTLSIPIVDIKSVIVESAPIFATLRIVTDAFSQNQTTVTYLKRNDAEHARRIINGLIVSARQRIDVTRLPTKKVVEKLQELGAIT